jgi:hypothetical protein
VDVLIPVFLALALAVGFTVGTGHLAERKGHSFALWAAIGFFTGLIGLLIAALIPAKKPA